MPDDSRLVVRIPYAPWQGPSGEPRVRARIVQGIAVLLSIGLTASWAVRGGLQLRGRGFVEFQTSLDWASYSTPVFLFALLVIGLGELDARGLNWSDVTTFLFAPDEAVAELQIEETRALLIDANLGRNHVCTLVPVEIEVLEEALIREGDDAVAAIRSVFGGEIPRVVQGVRV